MIVIVEQNEENEIEIVYDITLGHTSFTLLLNDIFVATQMNWCLSSALSGPLVLFIIQGPICVTT